MRVAKDVKIFVQYRRRKGNALRGKSWTNYLRSLINLTGLTIDNLEKKNSASNVLQEANTFDSYE